MTEKRKESQCTKVYTYMMKDGPITQKDADKFGCRRLAPRINDLEKRGVAIKHEMIDVINADGSKSRVARYSLEVQDAGTAV